MRVAREDTPGADRSSSGAPLQVGLLLLAFVLGFVARHLAVYRPLTDLIALSVHHPDLAVAAIFDPPDLPVLNVELRFRDYLRLLEQRDLALRLGINAPSDDDAVRATITHAGAETSVEIRLPAGMSGPLEGNRWPFEVTTRGNATLFGLRRFALTPADDSTLCTAGYLASVRDAGLLAPRYSLVRLLVNGDDYGVYAIEERPTAEMLAALERVGGVLVGFDGDAYWTAAARLGAALPGDGFQYARPILIDPQTARVRPTPDEIAALLLLERWRAGEIAPSDALAVEQSAEFLALSALWRGSPALDWRTIVFAYDPATQRLEPVATGTAHHPSAPLPDGLTASSTLRLALAQRLARWSDPQAVARLRAELGPELHSMSAALALRLGGLELPWGALEAHQAAFRYQVTSAPPLIAELEDTGTGLALRVANQLPFPVEIVGLDVGRDAFLTADPVWAVDPALLVDGVDGLVLDAASDTVRYVRLRVPPDRLSVTAPDEVIVIARIWGLAGEHAVVVDPPLAAQEDEP